MNYNKETEYITMFKEVAHIRAKAIRFGEAGLVLTKKTNEDKTTSLFFTIKLSSKLINQKTDSARLSIIAEMVSTSNDRIVRITSDEYITVTNLYTVEVVLRNEKHEENVQLYLKMFLNHKKIVDKLFDLHLRDDSFEHKHIDDDSIIEEVEEYEKDDKTRVISRLHTIIESIQQAKE